MPNMSASEGIIVGGGNMAFLNGSGQMIPFWCPVLLSAAVAGLPWVKWSRRFSLRAMLVAMAVVAVVLGMIFVSR
jgi:hypothetical protein